MDRPHHIAPILENSVNASLLTEEKREFDLSLRTLCSGLFRI
jgi:hypothetical protein